MEYFCSRGDDIWESDDAALIDLASRELKELGLAPGATILDAAVERVPDAYPIYDSTYRIHTWTPYAASSTRFPTCTRSLGTACIGTTTRITRCTRPC
jgi:protoporphyrinogen oxidase